MIITKCIFILQSTAASFRIGHIFLSSLAFQVFRYTITYSFSPCLVIDVLNAIQIICNTAYPARKSISNPSAYCRRYSTPSRASRRFTLSSSERREVSRLRAGAAGASKGADTPVKSFISPRRARA